MHTPYSIKEIAFFQEEVYAYRVSQGERTIENRVSALISENRLLNFSDAVFAFAATLLVLKLDLPQVSAYELSTDFLSVFSSLWPQYYANIISFIIIGYYWLNHHAVFGMMRTYNGVVVWMNLFFLLLVSFLPFSVDLFGSYPLIPGVVVFYSASLALVGYILAIMWWYAAAYHRLVHKHLSKNHMDYFLARNLIAPVVFTISIPLVAIDPMIAQATWIFVIVGVLWVNHIYRIHTLSTIEKMSL